MNYLENIEIVSATKATKIGAFAQRSKYFVINVADPCENTDADVWIPLAFQYSVGDPITIPVARLDLVAGAINYGLNKGKIVIVHCTAGIERSPLAVMWFLCTFANMGMNQAFEEVKKIRPQIVDRRNWIKYDSLEEFLQQNRSQCKHAFDELGETCSKCNYIIGIDGDGESFNGLGH